MCNPAFDIAAGIVIPFTGEIAGAKDTNVFPRKVNCTMAIAIRSKCLGLSLVALEPEGAA